MKKFKTKKYHNNSKLILLFLIIFFFIIFIYFSLHNLNTSYNSIVNFLLKDISKEKKRYTIVKNLNYLVNNYSFNNNQEVIEKETNMIYLYNTHDTEMYHDKTTVLDASIYLQNNLNKLGVKSVVEERKTSDYSIIGKNDYDITKDFLKDIMSNYNFFYFIDIHRDSATDTKITINSKDYAKILFVLGLDNPNYLKNKKVIEKMNDYLDKNYPGLSKGILEKGGKGVNGVYNQDLGENILLIEIGGIENNKEEINNSTEIIALMLYNLLGDHK